MENFQVQSFFMVQDDLETCIKTKGDKIKLEISDICLDYDLDQFNEKPEIYIPKQLGAHKEYKKKMEPILNNLISRFKAIMDYSIHLSEISENDSLRIYSEKFQVFRKFFFPALAKNQSVNTYAYNELNKLKFDFIAYSDVKDFIAHGQYFIESLKTTDLSNLSWLDKSELYMWGEVQNELLGLYSGFVNYSQRLYDNCCEVYKILFPKLEFEKIGN